MSMKGKPPEIDLLKLYAERKAEDWNLFLSACYNENSVEALMNIRYGICRGMDSLVKKKLNTTKMVDFFLRLQRSIELTIKKIHKKKFNFNHSGLVERRDQKNEVEKFILKGSY